MPKGTMIGSTRGYNIYYEAGNFYAYAGRVLIAENSTEEALKKQLDKIVKKKFKNLQVLQTRGYGSFQLVESRITSIVNKLSIGFRVWVSWKSDYGDSQREICYTSKFYAYNEHNLKIKEKLEVNQIQIDELRKLNEELMGELDKFDNKLLEEGTEEK